MNRVCLLTLTLALAGAPAALAQRATLTGTVVDSITGAPLEGVMVSLVELQLRTMTDSRGAFQFLGLQSGTHTVGVRLVGYEPYALRFRLTVDAQRRVDLGKVHLTPAAATELDPIRVEAEMVRAYPQLEGFFRRSRTEQGTFLTEADIQRENPKNTSDLVRRMPGFSTNEYGRVTSNRGVAGLYGFDSCEVEFYINGIHAGAGTVDVILPDAIVGMEVYSGSSTIPPMYLTSSTNPRCGVIAVWTRHTRRDFDP